MLKLLASTFLSPLALRFKSSDYTPHSGSSLQREPFTTRPVLTDGGVYDNLGLETAWKRYRTILVSDAGGKMGPDERPKTDWFRHPIRIFALVDSQVRSLRKQQVIDSYQLPRDGSPSWRDGAYWGIRTNILDYKLADSLLCPHSRTMQLAGLPTRLAAIDAATQERLVNWGYAVCDTAMRKYVVQPPTPTPAFPYRASGV